MLGLGASRGSRWSAIGVATAVLLVGGDRRARPDLTVLAGVDFTGCASVVAGPICRLPPSRTIRLIVPPTARDLRVTARPRSTKLEAREVERFVDAVAIEVSSPIGATAIDLFADVDGTERVFTLPVAVAPTEPPWLAHARSLKEVGEIASAKSALEAGVASDAAGAQTFDAEVAGLRGRLALRLGDPSLAVAELQRAIDLHAARGELSGGQR